MTAKRSVQLSRRDALKLLGAAAGATVLANLPSKWSTPQSVAGVLPAHAQTSVCSALLVEILSMVPGNTFNASYNPGPDEFSEPTFIAGSWARWDCKDRCIFVSLRAVLGATVRFTVMGFPPVTIPLGSADRYYVFFNVGTGDLKSGGGDGDPEVPDGCEAP